MDLIAAEDLHAANAELEARDQSVSESSNSDEQDEGFSTQVSSSDATSIMLSEAAPVNKEAKLNIVTGVSAPETSICSQLVSPSLGSPIEFGTTDRYALSYG